MLRNPLLYKSQPQQVMKKIFVNVFVDNILHHNRCMIEIENSSCGITEAGKLSVEIANEVGVDIRCVRFEIVK